ncbi:unnamed protein product [Thlaspi arvense]|uniref:DUF4283 domain-containing protein n=1 Tax=Thlaspi arvense TaxID=13288 RepID=A0AAU9SDV4_THLAR|nr:unnamed protein product [Thlaspi arvense]
MENVWEAMQNLSLGGESRLLQPISADARRVRSDNNRLSLIALGLNPTHQKPVDLKILLLKAWKLKGKLTSRINNDGTVQFYFKAEHHLMNILEHGPWHCNNWMVAIDRWIRRFEPDFLQPISFWVKILHIPEDFRSETIIHEVGDILGVIDEIQITEASVDGDSEVWIHVHKNIQDRLIFIRYMEFKTGHSTMVRFIYKKLRKFCFRCGALTHSDSTCQYEGEVYYRQHIVDNVSNISMPLQQQPDAELSQSGVGSSDAAHHLHHSPLHENVEGDNTMVETVESNAHIEEPSPIPGSVQADFQFRQPPVPFIPGSSPPVDLDAIRGTKRTGGGLAIFWDNHVQLDLCHHSLNFTDVYIRDGVSNYCISYVYGPPYQRLRQALWKQMQSSAPQYHVTPRLVLGDFNIRSNDEKTGGPLRYESSIAIF